MGEAKRRGTYEERKAEAMKRGLINVDGLAQHSYKRVTSIRGGRLMRYIQYVTPANKVHFGLSDW